MTENIRNVCLLSLGTRSYSRDAVDSIHKHIKIHGGGLRFIELDSIEEINRSILGITENRLDVHSAIMSRDWPGGSYYESMSSYLGDSLFQDLRSDIHELFHLDRRFRNLVNNQVFRSLHPKLKRIGVKNQRHPVVSRLSSYLLDELSLLAYLAKFRGITTEISLHAQNEVRDFLAFRGIILPEVEILKQDGRRQEALSVKGAEISIGESQSFGPFSFRVERGEIVGLLGVNGSGKTSLFRAIAGHYPLKSGTICFGERHLDRLPPYDRRVATVFQAAGLLPKMTGKANVDVGLRKGSKMNSALNPNSLTKTFLRKFDLESFWLRDAQVLSGGQKQIISLARALMSNPDVLLLDEPSASLDHISKRNLISFLKKMLRELECSTLVISHDSELLLSLCDRFVAIGSDGEQISVTQNGSYGSDGFSFSAAKILGLENLFEFSSCPFEGVVELDDPALCVRLGDAVGFHLPPDSFEQCYQDDCTEKPGVVISGWIADRMPRGESEMIFLHSNVDREAFPVMIVVKRGLVEVSTSALVRLRVASDRVRLMVR